MIIIRWKIVFNGYLFGNMVELENELLSKKIGVPGMARRVWGK